MPKYYVYDKNTGTVVHVHESYNAESGMSVRETEEEILNLLGNEYDVDKLAITVVDSEETQSQSRLSKNAL
jgi:hypothetical protein